MLLMLRNRCLAWEIKKMGEDLQATTNTQMDFVRGKGQGLIVLLCGLPGNGKTITAETVAAYTRRPLYSITCGDLKLTYL